MKILIFGGVIFGLLFIVVVGCNKEVFFIDIVNGKIFLEVEKVKLVGVIVVIVDCSYKWVENNMKFDCLVVGKGCIVSIKYVMVDMFEIDFIVLQVVCLMDVGWVNLN